jgi:acyl carrier protein
MSGTVTSLVEQRVCKLIRDVMGFSWARSVRPESCVADLHLDSLYLVGLAVALEDRFEIEVSDDAICDAKTVADIVALVDRALARKQPVTA